MKHLPLRLNCVPPAWALSSNTCSRGLRARPGPSRSGATGGHGTLALTRGLSRGLSRHLLIPLSLTQSIALKSNRPSHTVLCSGQPNCMSRHSLRQSTACDGKLSHQINRVAHPSHRARILPDRSRADTCDHITSPAVDPLQCIRCETTTPIGQPWGHRWNSRIAVLTSMLLLIGELGSRSCCPRIISNATRTLS